MIELKAPTGPAPPGANTPEGSWPLAAQVRGLPRAGSVGRPGAGSASAHGLRPFLRWDATPCSIESSDESPPSSPRPLPAGAAPFFARARRAGKSSGEMGGFWYTGAPQLFGVRGIFTVHARSRRYDVLKLPSFRTPGHDGFASKNLFELLRAASGGGIDGSGRADDEELNEWWRGASPPTVGLHSALSRIRRDGPRCASLPRPDLAPPNLPRDLAAALTRILRSALSPSPMKDGGVSIVPAADSGGSARSRGVGRSRGTCAGDREMQEADGRAGAVRRV